MTEIGVGALVLVRGFNDPRRVILVSNKMALVRQPVDEFEAWKGLADLTVINPEPPLLDEGKVQHTLPERRKALLANLNRLANSVEGDDRELVLRLRDAVRSGSWFWRSVAESVSDPRQVSYATEPRFFDVESGRRRSSLAKFLRTKARDNELILSGEKIDRLCQLVGDHFPRDYNYTFDIVSGSDDIQYAYSEEPNESWGSCMAGSPLVRWYGENGDVCRLIKIMWGVAYVGRALLWETVQGGCVVDRVYPSDNGPQTRALHDYARANGWDYKTNQSCCDGHLASGRMDYLVKMKQSKSGKYPYCDTFKYTSDSSNAPEITLGLGGGNWCFCSVNGNDPRPRRYRCSSCQADMIGGEAIFNREGDAYCPGCYENYYVFLSYMTSIGDVTEGWFFRGDCGDCTCCGSEFLRTHLRLVDCPQCQAMWCVSCVEDYARRCDGCARLVGGDDIRELQTRDGLQQLCVNCAEESGLGNEKPGVELSAETESVRDEPAAPPLRYPTLSLCVRAFVDSLRAGT